MPHSPGSSVDELLRLLPHLEVAHHIPGRIRLKVRTSALKAVQDIDIEAVVLSIPGIQSLRINPFARSAVIEYNREKLPPDLWTSLEQVKDKPDLVREIADRLRAGAET